jgi:hypothetical protein
MSNKLSVAEKCGRTMVVGVEEGKWLLLQDKEEGIDEFEVFGEIVQLQKVRRRASVDGMYSRSRA